MRAVVQRVTRACVRVDAVEVGRIDRGVVVLLGIARGDRVEAAHWLADKIAGLRLFEDADGKMNRDLTEIGGGILVVSQFTLYGDCQKGRRPSFVAAAPPDQAEPLYEAFVSALRMQGLTVATGQFRASMHVELVNDGPVTLIVERE